MFHRQLLGSTEAKKLTDWRVEGKGQRITKESPLSLDPFPFTLCFVRLTIYFNETPSCR
jgi:hypothetical protein